MLLASAWKGNHLELEYGKSWNIPREGASQGATPRFREKHSLVNDDFPPKAQQQKAW